MPERGRRATVIAATARAALLGCTVGWLLPADAAQMAIGTFNNLRRGMLESEVLLRAGPPDLVTSPRGDVVVSSGGVHGGDVVQFHYLPDAGEHDPQLTVVTITRGRVSALERRKILSPVAPAVPAAGEPQREADRAAPRSDIDIRRERAERTLDAAERYSDVRARAKERNAEARAGSSPGPVYRGTDEAGSPYFGDVPPPANTEH